MTFDKIIKTDASGEDCEGVKWWRGFEIRAYKHEIGVI
jgi:hypothetical protein